MISKKTFKIGAALIACFILVLSMFMVGCKKEPEAEVPSTPEEAYATHVANMVTTTNSSGDRTITVYTYMIKDSSNWNEILDDERKAITDSVVLSGRAQARADGTNDYQILGFNENGSERLFVYDRVNEQVNIFLSGAEESAGSIAAPSDISGAAAE